MEAATTKTRLMFKKLQNYSLVAISLLLFYVLAEFVIFPIYLRYLPLRFYGYLPEPFIVMAASSKKSTVPKNYIAIFGDSYAQGAGDWLLTSNFWKNPPFGSQHVLYQKLNRDVVQFGWSGSGNIRNLMVRPTTWFHYLNATLLYRVEQPKIILIYFYEGNDLRDNIFEVKDYVQGKKMDKIQDSDFRDYVNRFYLDKNVDEMNARSFQWYDNLILLKTIRKMLSRHFQWKQWSVTPGIYEHRNVNRVLVNGKVWPIPDQVQGGSFKLSDEETNFAFEVLRVSLAYVSDFFPKSKIYVIYVPSVFSSYQFVSRLSAVYEKGRPGNIITLVAQKMLRRSNSMRKEVEQITRKQGLTFIDATSRIREVSQKKFLHGPLEWNHFNQAGYETLAEVIIPFLLDSDLAA